MERKQPIFERYSIFISGGKQYQAIEGQTVALEKIAADEGQSVVFDQVLLRKTNAEAIEIGQPFVSSPVKATIVKHTKGPKLIAFKFKRRKKYRRKMGHRQLVTVVRIESI